MTTEIMIDPNVRVAGNETFAGFEDVVGDLPTKGACVRVREPESNIVGEGVVTRVDERDRLIYLAIDWSKLAERIMTPEELMRWLGTDVFTSTTIARTVCYEGDVRAQVSQLWAEDWDSDEDAVYDD